MAFDIDYHREEEVFDYIYDQLPHDKDVTVWYILESEVEKLPETMDFIPEKLIHYGDFLVEEVYPDDEDSDIKDKIDEDKRFYFASINVDYKDIYEYGIKEVN